MTAAEWASRTQGRCRRLGRGQLETQPRLPPPARLKPGGPSPETEISRTLSWPRPGRSAPDRGRAGPGGLLPPPVGARLGWAGEGTCSQCPGRGDQAQIPLPSLPAQMAARSGSGRGGGGQGCTGCGLPALTRPPPHLGPDGPWGAHGGRLPHCPPTGPLPSCGLHPGPPLPPTQAAPLHWPHVSSWPRPRPSGGCSGEPLLSPTPSSACWSDPQPFLLEMWGFQGAFHLAASCVGCSSRPRVRALTPQPWEGVQWAWGRSPKPAGAGPCSVLWSSSPCSHSSAAGCRARLPCRSHGQQTRVHPGFLRPCSPDSLAAPTARGVHPLPEKAATLQPCPGLDAQWVLTPATPPAQGPPRASFSSPHATRPPAALPFPD